MHKNSQQSCFIFDIKKYLGTWYELAHYPSWFQRNDNYNTIAYYELIDNNKIKVHNSTISHGKQFDSFGIAYQIENHKLYVDFSDSEVNKLVQSKEFVNNDSFNSKLSNYIISNNQLSQNSVNILKYITSFDTKNSLDQSHVTSPKESLRTTIEHQINPFSDIKQENIIFSIDKQSSELFDSSPETIKLSLPNYVIENIWLNCNGDYIFAIVTDSKRESLYILSRYKHPSLIAYNQIMDYVINNFDRDRLVQTPHFD